MSAITLRRIAPDQNMWRFYRLEVQVDLFGRWCLVREWGRIGRRGQMRSVSFSSSAEAETALQKQRRHKEQKGYAAS